MALLAKIWSARFALVGRFGTAGILIAFDASDRDVVALHLLRTICPRARITVVNLRETTASPEIAAFIADLRIRWSLKMLSIDSRHGSPSIRLNDEDIRTNPDAFRSLIRAARNAGYKAIAYSRRKAVVPLPFDRKKEAQAAVTWIDPASYFTDKDIRDYVEHFRLPVCRSTHSIAASTPIASHPELLERMRGLGYF